MFGTLAQILNEPWLVQKQTIHQMKAPSLRYLELKGQERGNILGYCFFYYHKLKKYFRS